LSKYIAPEDLLPISSQKPDKILYENKTGLAHECEKHFCPLDIVCVETSEQMYIVFVCDYCQVSMASETNMKRHLTDANHFSASEYFLDDQTKIRFIKKRSSLRNLFISNLFSVFCPSCSLCFGFDTQACGEFKFL